MNETRIESNGSSIDFWSILRLLFSKLHLLILAGIGAGAAVFLILTLFVTPKYESHVSFYVYNSSDSTARTGTINNNDLQAAESLAETYSKILESNSVLDAVLDDLGGTGNLTRKELGKMVDVSVISNTQLLNVVVTSDDAELACRIAQSFSKVAPKQIVRITKAGGVEVVDQPEVATEKSSPRTVFDSAVGVVAGVIIMSVIVIMRTLSDTTIYLPEDIEKLVGATVLGQIPDIAVSDGKYAYWNIEKGCVISFAEKRKTEDEFNTDDNPQQEKASE